MYTCPVWMNFNDLTAEKLRIFEKKCLHACYNMYRFAETGYKKYISNETLYSKVNINRIDNFIIKLTRNYFANIRKIDNNNLISLSVYLNRQYHERSFESGFIPPEAFITMDQDGLIQNQNNVPIIYHIPRNKANKKITYMDRVRNKQEVNPRYSTALPKKDIMDFSRLSKKYWWISNENNCIQKLRKRYDLVIRDRKK